MGGKNVRQLRIVGVVPNLRHDGPLGRVRPELYILPDPAVRVAFGARPAQVVGVMVRDAAWPVAIGLLTGLAGSYFATGVIRSFLFETTPHDPATLVTAVGLLGAAACLAAWLPARRAAAVDPVAALRAE